TPPRRASSRGAPSESSPGARSGPSRAPSGSSRGAPPDPSRGGAPSGPSRGPSGSSRGAPSDSSRGAPPAAPRGAGATPPRGTEDVPSWPGSDSGDTAHLFGDTAAPDVSWNGSRWGA